jgi:hypothetical protein
MAEDQLPYLLKHTNIVVAPMMKLQAWVRIRRGRFSMVYTRPLNRQVLRILNGEPRVFLGCFRRNIAPLGGMASGLLDQSHTQSFPFNSWIKSASTRMGDSQPAMLSPPSELLLLALLDVRLSRQEVQEESL